MNSRDVIITPAPESKPSRAGIPLDVATVAVRMLEFLLILGTGSLAIIAVQETLSVAEIAVHLRVVFIMAIAFAVLAESLGCYDLDAQF